MSSVKVVSSGLRGLAAGLLAAAVIGSAAGWPGAEPASADLTTADLVETVGSHATASLAHIAIK